MKHLARKPGTALVLLLSFSQPALQLAAASDQKNTAQSIDFADFTPFEIRDQNLFNLIHGQPLPTNARLNSTAQARWSSSLIITNTVNIENNDEESIFLDYESYRFNLSYQYGLTEDWNLKFDLPVLHQGGGMFDSAIDKWHDFFGLPRGKRPSVEHDQYNISYHSGTQSLLYLDEDSTRLGDIQLALARRVLEKDDTSMSIWAGIKLPTGDTDKLSGSGSADFSAWLALNQQLSSNWLLNLNAGTVILGGDTYQEMPLADHVLYGHVMLGWLLNENIQLKVQLQGHTSYYENTRLDILADTFFMSFGTTINISRCQQLDFAVSEDIKVDSTPDISLLINWRSYSSGC